MASIVDSTTRPDVEDFKFDGILAEDHAEIADPEATIFAHADYAVIGDLHEIVSAIIAELRKARGQ